MTSILVFAGSTRASSVNRQLAAYATATAQQLLADVAQAKVTHLELADFDIGMYNADAEALGTPPDVLRLKALLHAHSGWVICSPEYNASFTALLKNAIDWCSSPAVAGQLHGPDVVSQWGDGLKPFRGKVVGLMAASPGNLGGMRSLGALSALLLNLQCWVAPEQHALARANLAFAPDGSLSDAHDTQRVRAVVQQVIWAAGRFSANT